jgi:hypothetical protein
MEDFRILRGGRCIFTSDQREEPTMKDSLTMAAFCRMVIAPMALADAKGTRSKRETRSGSNR